MSLYNLVFIRSQPFVLERKYMGSFVTSGSKPSFVYVNFFNLNVPEKVSNLKQNYKILINIYFLPVISISFMILKKSGRAKEGSM